MTRLDECRLVAILRGITPTEVEPVAEALLEARFDAVEVPLNSPEPLESIRRLAVGFGERMLVGAGTVLHASDVKAVKRAGGRLIVTPNIDPAVIDVALELALEIAPGFATATEACIATARGVRTLKLFPAASYGAAHVAALKAVLPKGTRIIAVGGIGSDALSEWRHAGADGFGVGSDLYRPGDSPAQIARKAHTFVRALSVLTD